MSLLARRSQCTVIHIGDRCATETTGGMPIDVPGTSTSAETGTRMRTILVGGSREALHRACCGAQIVHQAEKRRDHQGDATGLARVVQLRKVQRVVERARGTA
jgi:hypothetical protein